jgi:hypothetical protein
MGQPLTQLTSFIIDQKLFLSLFKNLNEILTGTGSLELPMLTHEGKT